MNLVGIDLVRISVGAELSPAQASNFTPLPGDIWIIGGSPSSPSAPDDIIAGNPDVPAGDVIIGGSPSVPS